MKFYLTFVALLSSLVLFNTAIAQVVDLELEKTDSKKQANPKFMLIAPMTIKGVNDSLRDQIKKSIVSLIIERKDYQILISNKIVPNQSTQVHELSFKLIPVAWGNDIRGFNIEAQLTDKNTSEIIVARRRRRVTNQQLVYQSEQTFLDLFRPQTDIPLEPQGLETELDEGADLNNKNKDKSKAAAPEEPLIDANADDQDEEERVAEVEKKVPEKKTKKPEKKKPRKRPLSLGAIESPDLNLKKDNPFNKVAKITKPESRFSFFLGQSQELINSKNAIDGNVVEVDNTIELVSFRAQHKYFFDGFDSNHVRSSLGLSVPTTSTEFEFSNRYKLGLEYHLTGLTKVVGFYGGINYETSSFVNIGQRGDGFRSWSVKSIWTVAGAELDLSSFGWNMQINVKYGQPLSSTTDLNTLGSDLALEGNFLEYSVQHVIWKRFFAFASLRDYTQTSLSLQTFENTVNEVFFGVVYR